MAQATLDARDSKPLSRPGRDTDLVSEEKPAPLQSVGEEVDGRRNTGTSSSRRQRSAQQTGQQRHVAPRTQPAHVTHGTAADNTQPALRGGQVDEVVGRSDELLGGRVCGGGCSGISARSGRLGKLYRTGGSEHWRPGTELTEQHPRSTVIVAVGTAAHD